MKVFSRVVLALILVVGSAASAATAGAPPVGYYECYFYGTYGLQGSSITSIDILDDGRYRALGEVGSYSWDAGTNTLDLTGAALAGRVAHMKQSDGKPAIVFVRKENEVGGKPTIDISDTWCYFEPR